MSPPLPDAWEAKDVVECFDTNRQSRRVGWCRSSQPQWAPSLMQWLHSLQYRYIRSKLASRLARQPPHEDSKRATQKGRIRVCRLVLLGHDPVTPFAVSFGGISKLIALFASPFCLWCSNFKHSAISVPSTAVLVFGQGLKRLLTEKQMNF